jgi:hypothetical protein
MTLSGRDGPAARLLSALLAFVLLGVVGLTRAERRPAVAAAPVHSVSTGDHTGAVGGSPGVLPRPAGIHVLANRADAPGAPSFAATAAPRAAAALPGRAGSAATATPETVDGPAPGSERGRAPPNTSV